MMNVQQSMHNVTKVHATRLYPSNSNAVTIQVETESGTLQQVLYFGDQVADAARANHLFYALGGKPENVVRK